MIQTILYTVGAWLGTSALFIGVPIARALRADHRRAIAAGAGDPAALLWRRFALQRPRVGPISEAVTGRQVWIERWSPGRLRERTIGRVEAVDHDGRILQMVDDAGEHFRFCPERESGHFAEGRGIGSGTQADGRAVVIFI